MKKLLLIFAVVAIVLSSCGPYQGHGKRKHLVVHTYKSQKVNDDDVSDMFFYLLDFGDSYYYTSSPTPISNFSSVSWSKSSTIKNELEQDKVQELEQENVEIEEFSQDIQAEAAEDPGSFEASDADGGSSDGGDGGSDGGSSDGGDGGGGGD